MRYILCLSYDGSAFCGWQIQPSSPSVQQCLEEALAKLCGGPVTVTGAGRTDTGVHAADYVCHFDLTGSLPFEASDFCYKLNAILPRSVAVHSVLPAANDFHARFSAVQRSYTYFIHRKKDPFVAAHSWQCGYPDLDFDAMNEACRHLLGTHDFSCFEKVGGANKTSISTVSEAFWKPYTPTLYTVMQERTGESDYWYFRVSADRFLRNMVRAIVGTLIEVGRGKHDPDWVADLVATGKRGDAGESVPGHALFLSKVRY
ncbi:MAG: tRNA pseudouridine(38-40) synthase TruA [Bacteroidales bacterium]|nr:tRNA pseudouridine(38-40) synthase TruA [Bacteroidales bacterium]